MDIIHFSIRNPVKVTVGVLLTVLFGLLALAAVPIQMTPDVERPIIQVRTNWQGRSPEEIETSILLDQEEKLKTIQGLYKMTSSASLGRGSIELEFNVGYDMGRATQEVSNRLNEVRNYPEDVDRPVIRSSSSQTDEAIAYVLIQSEAEDEPDFDVATFYDYADRHITSQLERIPGLSQVDIMGAREHEIQVRFDPSALAQSGVTIAEFQNAIRADNINESAGDLSGGRTDYRFRVVGRFESLEPLRNGIVKYVNGVPIYVKDLADIHLVLKKSTFFQQSKGKSSIVMIFRRETGANVLTVIDNIKKTLAELTVEGGPFHQYKNDRYKIRPRLAFDDSTYIKNAIKLVRENLYSGGVLAILVLLIFLRSTRPTLIIAVSIPISTLGTFIVLYVMGRNINVISLAGLTFAIGMVVDNSIVVLENIDRHLHMGKKPWTAAYDGTKEVWGAVLSSTLTTVAVFAPILTIQEEAGQLFYDIGIAISGAILFSLLVSITVIPTAAVFLLKDQSKTKHNVVTRAAKSLFGTASLFAKWSTAFAHFLYVLMTPNLAGVWTRIVCVVAVTIASLWLCVEMMPPASYLPNGNKNFVFAAVNTPPATSYRQNTLTGQLLQDSIKPYWEAKTRDDLKNLPEIVDMRTGKVVKNIPPIAETWTFYGTNGVRMMAVNAETQNVRPLIALLNDTVNKIPGSTGMSAQGSLFGRRSGGNMVQIEVTGNDMGRLRSSTEYLERRLEGEFSQAGVSTSPTNYNMSGPEYQLVINHPRAKELGIALDQIGVTVRALIDGIYAGDYDFEGDNIDLYVIRDPDIPLSPYQVADLPIAVRGGGSEGDMIIPLSEIVHFVQADSSQQIRRYEQQRAIRIQVSPPDDMALEEAQRRVFAIFEQSKIEGGVTPDIRILLAGSADKLTQVRAAMMGKWTGFNTESLMSLLTSRFFLSLLITYLLMAALFENFVYPFVIMFSVPLAMTGGILGLAMVHSIDPLQQMDTLAMLGFVILIGVVVNNAILLVHQSLNFMRGFGESEDDIIEKMPYREAICESVRTRLRPIFMTTLTSLFGMLPLVLFPGEGSELYRGLGAVVLGGLACSTVFTLFLVPTLLSLILDFNTAVGRLRTQES